MKFIKSNNDYSDPVLMVYHKDITKDSYYMGDIIGMKVNGSHGKATHYMFYACGNERMLSSTELRAIANKLDEVNEKKTL